MAHGPYPAPRRPPYRSASSLSNLLFIYLQDLTKIPRLPQPLIC